MPFLLSLSVVLLLSVPALACCTVWGKVNSPVQIASQEVLIVWDEENRTEHFVRRANFETEDIPEDFGFLVPTPMQPKLSEISDSVFKTLSEAVRPEVKTKTRFRGVDFMPMVLMPYFMKLDGRSITEVEQLTKGVEVLDRAFVGGFEAAVLRASDAEELIQWLEENDYDARPALRDWITPYVEKEWIVTAFKYACDKDHSSGSLTRASICMSFETDAPFFPYRVPSDTRVKPEDGSLLRLYFAGTERVVGDFEGGENGAWTAETKFSGQDELAVYAAKQVAKVSGGDSSIPASSWLTVFEDHTWPGGAEDLYFKSSPEQDSVTPEPVWSTMDTRIPLPLDLLLLVGGVAYFYKKRSKKRARRT